MIVRKVEAPTIGIGAGNVTAGQVLVLDLVGFNAGHVAKFVKRYADVRGEMRSGLGKYVEEVRSAPSPPRSMSTASIRPNWKGCASASTARTWIRPLLGLGTAALSLGAVELDLPDHLRG